MSEQTQGQTAPLAITSFVLALLGLITPFSLLAAVAAVICGHMALPKIKRSGGRLTGEGLAAAGLAMGYVAIGLYIIILTSAAMILPALDRARAEARKAVCMNNLMQIGEAALTYTRINQDNFPPDLQSLLPYLSSTRALVSPTTGNLPGSRVKVDEWSDYVLVPNRTSGDPPDAVLVFTKPHCYPDDGGNILFVDGTVRWVQIGEYRRLTEGLQP